MKGKSPLWIRGIMAVFRVWFFIYDILNYLPYQLFNSPVEKLRKSGRVKVRTKKTFREKSCKCNVTKDEYFGANAEIVGKEEKGRSNSVR